MGVGPEISGLGTLCALPLRRHRQQALSRRHAREERLRRHGDGKPQILSRAGQNHRGAGNVPHRCREPLRLRTLLRSQRAGLEPRAGVGSRRGETELRSPNLRLPLWSPRRVGQCDRKAHRAGIRAPSIGLIEDPVEACSGPLWVRGGVRVISADGFQYEIRNRVTLCRCSASRNKPFCDGSHAAIKFKDDISPCD